MGKCVKCGSKSGIVHYYAFEKKWLCDNCIEKYEIKRKEKEEKGIEQMRSGEYIPKPGEIKCPYCSLFFTPKQKRPTSTGGNIARGAVFLPWGVVSSVKNKPFVQCPHCKMKIPQG